MIEAGPATFYRLFALLAAVGLTLVGGILVVVATFLHLRDRYVESVVADLRPAIAARASREEPNWHIWVAERSLPERYVLQSEIRRQLETTSGAYRSTIADLGAELGVDDLALRQVSSTRRRARHRGFVTLLLLESNLSVEPAVATAETHYERAVIVHLCLDDPGEQSRAVELLLEPGTPLPGYALHTLYRAVSRDPEAILAATPKWESWDTTLVVQVLSVLQHVEWGQTPAIASWLRVCLSADAPAIRSAAVNALEPYVSEHGDVPPFLAVDGLLSDPSIRVRAAAFRQLSSVDDRAIRQSLRAVADREPSDIGNHVVAVELGGDTLGAPWSINWRAPWRLEWEHQPIPAHEDGEANPTELRA